MSSAKSAVSAAKFKSTIASVIGWVLGIFGVLAMVVEFFPPADSQTGEKPAPTIGGIILAGIFFVIGVFLIVKGISGKKLISDFHKYVGLLNTDPDNNISTIARGTGETMLAVKRKLNKMIKKNFFGSVSLDERTDRLVIGQNTFGTLERKAEETNAAAHAVPEQLVSVVCPACNARVNVPVGKSIPCEYCGTIVRGE